MTAVAPANSTWAYIEQKVRKLTASSGQSSLTSTSLQTYGNNFVNQYLPNVIKTDQMRSVYTFYTQPYIDKYPLDVNYNQGVRAPFYVDGIEGTFCKDRQQFFNMWPKWPTLFQQSPTSLTGTITAATNANPCQITSTAHGLPTGAVITISGVGGMVQLNGGTFTITIVDANNFTLNSVDSTAFGVYTSGGTWVANSQTYSFTISNVPFYRGSVTIGAISQAGGAIQIQDDGQGNLQLLTPNPQVSVPQQNTSLPLTAPIPGMLNRNTGNPGLNAVTNIGTVNYVTGQMAFALPSGYSVATGEVLRIFVSQYNTGRPFSLLFWNNEFTIRPVPKYVHKIEIESYLTPVQFMLSTDHPIMDQWVNYISFGISIDILRDRGDFQGVSSLMPFFQKEESVVLERQATEELFQRNSTIFSSSVQGQGNYCGNWGSWY